MRSVKKSRNGCARCKGKRLKCDEAKPSCGRCTRAKVRCPGYAQQLKWSSKYEFHDGQLKPSRIDEKGQHESHTPEAPASTSGVTTQGHPETSIFDGSSVAGEPLGLSEETWSLDHSTHGHEDPYLTDGLNHLAPDSDITGFERAWELKSLSSADGVTTRSPTFSDIANLGDSSISIQNLFHEIERSADHQLQPSTASNFSVSMSRVHELATPLLRGLDDPSSTLVEYYFKEVAGIFSCYDSGMNPFRATVSRLWDSSPAIYFTLQSMAAACLVDEFPQFGPIGLRLRNSAAQALEKESVLDDKSCLALLMLGQTASWHDPGDLGLPFFNRLRDRIDNALSDRRPPSDGLALSSSNNIRFFQEALVYWEMLLSYVTDPNALISSQNSAGSENVENVLLQQVPHPWTGIAKDTQVTVYDVGTLIRDERKRMRTRSFTTQADIARAKVAIDKAQALEKRLLTLVYPAEMEVVSPGDFETPVWHLLTIAEVYRRVGLLQLYRVFPDLLNGRLLSDPASLSVVDVTLPREPISSEEGISWDDETAIAKRNNDWLTCLALDTLKMVKSVPFESRTRCCQPFLLVTCSSELRIPHKQRKQASPGTTRREFDESLPSSQSIEVARMRKFVLTRLNSFLSVLPPKPTHICIKLVRTVWERMDKGDEAVYWMDVMTENGWETTMG